MVPRPAPSPAPWARCPLPLFFFLQQQTTSAPSLPWPSSSSPHGVHALPLCSRAGTPQAHETPTLSHGRPLQLAPRCPWSGSPVEASRGALSSPPMAASSLLLPWRASSRQAPAPLLHADTPLFLFSLLRAPFLPAPRSSPYCAAAARPTFPRCAAPRQNTAVPAATASKSLRPALRSKNSSPAQSPFPCSFPMCAGCSTKCAAAPTAPRAAGLLFCCVVSSTL
jgi:hypothetical protein